MKTKPNPAVIKAQKMAATMHEGGSYKVVGGIPKLIKTTTETTTTTKKEK